MAWVVKWRMFGVGTSQGVAKQKAYDSREAAQLMRRAKERGAVAVGAKMVRKGA